MPVLFLFYILLLGLAVGSFTNVLVFRYNTGKTIRGRSFCTSCARTIPWYDLIPVASYLFLRGTCRHCKAKISPQYPLVELSTAVLYLLAAQNLLVSGFSLASISHFLILLVIVPLLVAITVYDMRHKIIPDRFVFGFAACALLLWLFAALDHGFGLSTLVDFAAGPFLFLPFFLLWFLSKGRLMGLGDGKLALCIGWMLGLSGGISAILFGFWSGALIGLFLLAVSHVQRRRSAHSMKELSLKSEIPFGPFLIWGIVQVEFFGFSVFGWLF